MYSNSKNPDQELDGHTAIFPVALSSNYKESTESESAQLQSNLIRSEVREKGYAFFEGLLPSKSIGAIASDIKEILDKYGYTCAPGNTTPSSHLRMMPQTVPENEILAAIFSNPLVLALPYQSGLATVMKSLVGEPLLLHPRKYLRVIFPESIVPMSETPVHQDVTGLNSCTDLFTAWIPIANCGNLAGGLQILEGSHKFGIQPFTQEQQISSSASSSTDLTWRVFDYNPGDVIFFHSHTVHAAPKNLSSEIRISLELRFQNLSDPMNDWLLRANYKQEGKTTTDNLVPELWCQDFQQIPSSQMNIVSDENNINELTKFNSKYI